MRLTPQDITTDTLLHQHAKHYALKGLSPRVGPVDYVGKVCEVSTDQFGKWHFKVRYIHQPGRNRKGAEYWSKRLYEDDLCYFEPITLDKVMEWLAVGSRKTPRLPAWMKLSQPPAEETSQLQLYDGCEGDEVSGWL
jgi:hypothetical protein